MTLFSTSSVTTEPWQSRLKKFFTVFDERFEAYRQGSAVKMFFRDFQAAVIVALVAIPLGVGFSIASGMRPEQGIIAGAVAGILGGIFGGSKYQVYGPTAAFITVLSGIITRFDYGFLLLTSVIAGLIILLLGIGGLGKYFRWVPHCVIVGFTMGIAATIIISQLPDALGAHGISPSHNTFEKLQKIPQFFQDANAHALVLAMLTFYLIHTIYRVSVYIPAPLIAIGLGTFIANQIWHDNFIPLVSTKYGHISENMFKLTWPSLGSFSLLDLLFPVMAIVFIAALESLLSSRMADRLAGNNTPYNPDKELFGQGVVNIIAPLFNGFPCTGALARTATSIKVGAVSPISSILKGITVILLMAFFAQYLSIIPMSCIGGLLICVATNMVKPEELQVVWLEGWLHVMLMIYTALMTILTDLMTAVMTATLLFYVIRRLCGMAVSTGFVKPNAD